ncbi:MAG: efflux RND transporter permease subunit [Schleiferiaceae bacterium]
MEENKSLIKQFGPSTFSVKNRMTVYVLTVIIFAAGIFSYTSMPSEAFPEIVTPEIYVGTPYPGNSPVDIEKLITRPLEKEINGISGVDEINSTSVEGYSTVQVKFNFDVTPEDALRKVKDKVDAAMGQPDFPSDLPVDPNVFELNFSELMPIMNINMSGEFSLDQLKDYGEYLEEKIEDLTEISKVDIRGIDDKEVRVLVDTKKLESLQLSFRDIAGAIQNENMTISGGNLLVDGYRRNVRVVGEIRELEELRNVIIKSEKMQLVRLADVAEVEFDEVERESYARQYGSSVVMLDVFKRSGENQIIVSKKIAELLEEANSDYFPDNLSISVTNDTSEQTKTQVADLENSIIFGMLLVVLVLMFFLGLRNALFVGIAIPMSMLMSFVILNAMGITLNTIVLFALVLALGMLVDNGIVVVENIYRFMDEGYSRIEAAKLGAGEVALPIIASTATTLAAFLPLAFWPGLFGEFMKYLPLTLITVLSSSLFVALVINPGLTSALMKVDEAPLNKKRLSIVSLIAMVLGAVIAYGGGAMAWGNLFIYAGGFALFYAYLVVPATAWFQGKALPALEASYKGVLSYALNGMKPIVFFAGTFVLLVLSGLLLVAVPPKTLFFPENMPNQAMVYIQMPIGTDIEETNAVTLELEKEVMAIVREFDFTDESGVKQNYMVESVIAQVGEGTSDPNAGPSMAKTPNKAKITVQFHPFAERLDPEGNRVNSADVLNKIRATLSNYPGVVVSVAKDSNGPPTGPPVNIEVAGDDYFALVQTADEIRTFINSKGIDGIEELKLDVETGKPEMPIEVDRIKARALGLSSAQIGDAMRTALFGKEVSRFKDGEDDYPINLRMSDEYRYNVEDLMNQKVTFRDQATGRIKQVPISAVAKARKTSTFSSVKRIDLKRVISIQSNVLEGANPTEVVNGIKEVMEGYELPRGVKVDFTGEQEEQAKELSFLSGALLIAVFLIFLILVSQFNSASTPFIILVTVVFSLIGVFLGLVIFRMEFVIMMTMIGIISLAGIVVNNAIVLIDFIKQLTARKHDELSLGEDEKLPTPQLIEVIVEAGRTRLRPVLLTAITTILGLIPLATGMNINFYTLFSENDPNIFFGGDNVVFWGPMSWTVIFGLTFATFLTLVIVPVMYYIFERVQRFFAKLVA